MPSHCEEAVSCESKAYRHAGKKTTTATTDFCPSSPARKQLMHRIRCSFISCTLNTKGLTEKVPRTTINCIIWHEIH